jgi:hypothetical protein
MTTKPTLGLIFETVLRALAFLDTREKYEGATNSPRPGIFSRRAIHGFVAVCSLLLSAIKGIEIPEEAITQLMDSGAQLYDAGWPLLITFGSACGVIVGIIKRKK